VALLRKRPDYRAVQSQLVHRDVKADPRLREKIRKERLRSLFRLNDEDLRRTLAALVSTKQPGESVTQEELAVALGVSRPTVGWHLSALERDGVALEMTRPPQFVPLDSVGEVTADGDFAAAELDEVLTELESRIVRMITQHSGLQSVKLAREVLRKRILPVLSGETPDTLEELGQAHGLSRARIGQIEAMIREPNQHPDGRLTPSFLARGLQELEEKEHITLADLLRLRAQVLSQRFQHPLAGGPVQLSERTDDEATHPLEDDTTERSAIDDEEDTGTFWVRFVTDAAPSSSDVLSAPLHHLGGNSMIAVFVGSTAIWAGALLWGGMVFGQPAWVDWALGPLAVVVAGVAWAVGRRTAEGRFGLLLLRRNFFQQPFSQPHTQERPVTETLPGGDLSHQRDLGGAQPDGDQHLGLALGKRQLGGPERSKEVGGVMGVPESGLLRRFTDVNPAPSRTDVERSVVIHPASTSRHVTVSSIVSYAWGGVKALAVVGLVVLGLTLAWLALPDAATPAWSVELLTRAHDIAQAHPTATQSGLGGGVALATTILTRPRQRQAAAEAQTQPPNWGPLSHLLKLAAERATQEEGKGRYDVWLRAELRGYTGVYWKSPTPPFFNGNVLVASRDPHEILTSIRGSRAKPYPLPWRVRRALDRLVRSETPWPKPSLDAVGDSIMGALKHAEPLSPTKRFELVRAKLHAWGLTDTADDLTALHHLIGTPRDQVAEEIAQGIEGGTIGETYSSLLLLAFPFSNAPRSQAERIRLFQVPAAAMLLTLGLSLAVPWLIGLGAGVLGVRLLRLSLPSVARDVREQLARLRDLLARLEVRWQWPVVVRSLQATTGHTVPVALVQPALVVSMSADPSSPAAAASSVSNGSAPAASGPAHQAVVIHTYMNQGTNVEPARAAQQFRQIMPRLARR